MSGLIAPSDADGVISVGAVDFDGVVADFSSRGPTADGRIKPDIAAPGEHVWLVDPTSQTDYAKGNGTSLAAPLAAGAASLLLEAFPGLDPAAMRTMLRDAGSLAAAPNDDLGWGLLDASAPFADGCADEDGDGALAAVCGGEDCDDADPDVHPGVTERCDDERDNDCDQLVDDLDPACAGEASSGADAGTAGSDTGPPGGSDDTGEPANDQGSSGELADGGGDGCTCDATRTTGSTALLLAWLLLGVRRRRAAATR